MSGSMLVQIFVAICLHPLTTANAVEDFSNLPVSQPWREVMDSIHTTNDIDVLPAYDINNVIPPVEHAVRLPGATVEPHLALICFFIASKGESGIVAEICKTNVLIPPGCVTTRGCLALKRKYSVRSYSTQYRPQGVNFLYVLVKFN
ncbi:hypothetical protein BD410DRAFT_846760 [Rickenella mellea]|uniref:Uncharacterized protein n=1 Tax=Rickenella mellea TaxID=50990 RepID=A0A4Y7PGY3_9AGAM|nr:hypothetical protein BD410DRAFT_846760 [Rickenella mellea]